MCVKGPTQTVFIEAAIHLIPMESFGIKSLLFQQLSLPIPMISHPQVHVIHDLSFIKSVDNFCFLHSESPLSEAWIVDLVRRATARRPRDWIEKDFQIKGHNIFVQGQMLTERTARAARFIGITESEYKEILVRKNPELAIQIDSPYAYSWRQQMEAENEIKNFVDLFWNLNVLSEDDLDKVISLIQNHSSLASSWYCARLFHLWKSLDQGDLKFIVFEAILKSIDGINSGRLASFCQQTVALLVQKYPSITQQIFVDLLTCQYKNGSYSKEDIQQQIIMMIEEDIKLLQGGKRCFHLETQEDLEKVAAASEVASLLNEAYLLHAGHKTLFIESGDGVLFV
jgi:hypothetical protein